MSRTVSPEARGPQSKRWWVGTVVLLIIAAGFLAVGLRSPDAAPRNSPVPPHHAAPSALGGNAATPSGAVDPLGERSAPVELRIPAIGVSVSVSALGLRPDHTVEVPTDFEEPGWFRLGPSPGQLGSAVILGHVDSYRGPAVFFRLRTLRAGDEVDVSLADGAVAHFVVTSVATYPKEQFPAQQVYASHGSSTLHLVTCGGEFDRNTRSYRSNVVAYTSLIATTPAATPVAGGAKPAIQD